MLSSPSLQQSVIGSDNIFSATGDVYVIQTPLPPTEARTRRDLGILLSNVKKFWIDGFLEQSFQNSLLLELDKETRPESIDHPWESILQLPNQANRSLPRGTKIGDIFDQSNRALLILGEPGSGKTITLVELAKELVARVENSRDFGQPIPVIFNLSSWAVQRQPLLDWMAAELSEKYRIPKQLGRVWLQEYRLLPLLDGLDEVKAEYRAACTEAINTYCYAFGLAGLAVCCRIADYVSLPLKLKLNAAISLQPLAPRQIDEYLSNIDLHSVRDLIQKDSALLALMQSPLMLNIFSVVYRDASVEIPTIEGENKVEKHRQQIFNAYVEFMFKRKGQNYPYSRAETLKWLSWLAQRMIEHNQSIFLPEQLQPSWLRKGSLIWAYALISRLLATMTMSLYDPVDSVIKGMIAGGVDGLRFELAKYINTKKNVLIDGLKFFWRHGLLHGFLIGMWSWIYYGLLLRFFQEPMIQAFESIYSITNPNTSAGLIVSVLLSILPLVAGFASFLSYVPVFRLGGQSSASTHDVRTMENLAWTWKGAFQGGMIGFLFGIILGIIAYRIVLIEGPRFGLDYSSCIKCGQQLGLWLTIFCTLLIGGLGGIINGLRGRKLEAGTPSRYGIRLWLRNAGIGVIVFGMVAEALLVFFGVILGLARGSLLFAVILGLIYSVLGLLALPLPFLVYGGLDMIKHMTIRILLSLTERLPWNLSPFLDYASERIFLHKVGGGYIFVHRLLMEHFAATNGNPKLS